MKKLLLSPDELRVESFPTAALQDGAPGTVRGHFATQGHTCVLETRCAARSCVSFGAPTCTLAEL
ncbi:hypothetical protein [Longimicrobium sp.]|uniref:hypothetical protein n=1 Tax=Longimicrobium sp. TaxID=2029185 RepID=UPI002D016134|nr:hypothetical protein [Longimicrobium sp.]HSU14429.1 hypothetical protein [Longimicrobium sp.]